MANPQIVVRDPNGVEVTVTAHGPDVPPKRRTRGFAFVAEPAGGAASEHWRLCSTLLLASAEVARLGQTADEIASAVDRGVLRTGFAYMRSCLEHGETPDKEYVYTTKTSKTDLRELVQAAQNRPCERLRQLATRSNCAEAEESGLVKPWTTQAICNECGYPEMHLRCRHLRGEMIGVSDLEGPGLAFRPVCDQGNGLRDPRECLERECFEPWVVEVAKGGVDVREQPDTAIRECPFSVARLCRALESPDPILVFIAGSADPCWEDQREAVKRGVRKAGMEPYFATDERVMDLGQDAFCEKICGRIRRCVFALILLNAPPHPDHDAVLLHSPNVYYEFGLMKAFGKRVLPFLVKEQGGKLPFDIQHLEVSFYEPDGLEQAVYEAVAKHREMLSEGDPRRS